MRRDPKDMKADDVEAQGEEGHMTAEAHVYRAPSPKPSRKGRTRASFAAKPNAVLPASEISLELIALQRRRRFCINEVNRSANACGSFVRSQLGWSMALSEKERETIRKRAAKVLKAAVGGKPAPELGDNLDTVLDSIGMRQPMDDRRKAIEKQMVALAKQLPVAEWAKTVRGFGCGIALAVIIGESGDLSQYATVSKLWKRLGWAPKETYKAGENGAHMVPRRVKGELYGVLVISLMTKDNQYRELYRTRKDAYLERGLVKNHAHKLAIRVMLKTLLADLWGAWREADSRMQPILGLPPANHLDEAAS